MKAIIRIITFTLLLQTIILNISISHAEEKIIALSIQDAIEMAMENNIDIKIESYSKEIAEIDVIKSIAEFDTQLSAELLASRRLRPEASAFASPEVGRDERQKLNIGIGSKTFTGTAYSLDLSNIRTKTNSTFAGLNPEYSSNLSLSITQPLLKGFGIDINKRNIIISQNNREISEHRFKELVIDVVSDVQTLYWDMVFAIEDLKVKKESLKLAEEFRREAKVKVEIGTLPPIELLGAEAEVASRKEGVIIAENRLLDIEDRLKNIIRVEEGRLMLSSDLYDSAIMDEEIDKDEYIERAFKNRPDYQKAAIELKNKKILVKYYNNQKYPSIDLKGSFSLNGLSGDAKSVTFGGAPQVSSFGGNYIDNLERLKSGKYYSWEAGIVFSIPIQNRSAKANLKEAQIATERSLFLIKRIEDKINLEVNIAVRGVEASIQRIKATRLSRELAEEKLKAEEKRFQVGVSTGFKLLEFQRDLAEEKSREIKAIADYKKAIVELDSVTADTLEKKGIILK